MMFVYVNDVAISNYTSIPR